MSVQVVGLAPPMVGLPQKCQAARYHKWSLSLPAHRDEVYSRPKHQTRQTLTMLTGSKQKANCASTRNSGPSVSRFGTGQTVSKGEGIIMRRARLPPRLACLPAEASKVAGGDAGRSPVRLTTP